MYQLLKIKWAKNQTPDLLWPLGCFTTHLHAPYHHTHSY